MVVLIPYKDRAGVRFPQRLILLLILLFAGCANLSDEDAAKWMLIPNAAGAYWVSIANHEYGHAAVAHTVGATNVTVHLTPSRQNGRFQPGYVEFNHSGLSEASLQSIALAGPASSFLQSVVFRSALRAGIVPRLLQPTFGWLDIGGRALSYYHGLAGVAGVRGADLDKVDDWLAWSFLGLNVLYDIVSFALSDDDFETYFGVLFGEKFYESP